MEAGAQRSCCRSQTTTTTRSGRTSVLGLIYILLEKKDSEHYRHFLKCWLHANSYTPIIGVYYYNENKIR